MQEKEKLVAEQKAGGKAWTETKQARLDEVVVTLLDLQDELEGLEATAAEATATSENQENPTAYVPKPGTEGFYHVRMTQGSKYDSETGEQIAKPFIQTYTKGEYKHFEQFGKALGYKNIEVLWDPTKQG